MSSIVVAGDTSGSVTLSAPAVAGSTTLTLPSVSGTVLTNGTSVITSGTAVASTSGTSIDFTGIPSWAKRVTVMFNGVSTNGSSIVQIQIGSGSVSTTGYRSTSYFATSLTSFAYATTGFVINSSYTTASNTNTGIYTFNLIGSNTWVGNGSNGADATAQITWSNAGASPTLGGTLDRVRITTVNGTDTFDAGSINILYE